MMTIERGILQYLQELRLMQKKSILTICAYETDLQQFADFLEDKEMRLQEIQSFQIRAWLASLKEESISNSTIKRKASALQSFFNYCLRHGWIIKNPVKQLLLSKKEKKIPEFIKEEDTKNILKLVEFEDSLEGKTEQLILEILYQTGIRRAELIQLKEQDIHFERKEIIVWGKGGKERMIPVQEGLLTLIKNYLKIKKENFENSTIYLLSLKSGKKLYDNYVYRVVKKHLNAITTIQQKSPHLLRHTFASQLLNNGANLEAIKDLLGHSSLAATQVYTHLNIKKLQEIYKKTHPKS